MSLRAYHAYCIAISTVLVIAGIVALVAYENTL